MGVSRPVSTSRTTSPARVSAAPDSNLAKPVTIENNEIHNCQYGLWIGNGYDCYAGDVHIDVTLNNNNIHDNTDGAAWIQDEDKADGSSVTVSGNGNSVVNNGTYGYYVYTNGDGDVTVDLSQDWISGNGTGVSVYDEAAVSGSSYDVAIGCSRIGGNGTGVAVERRAARAIPSPSTVRLPATRSARTAPRFRPAA